VALNGKRDFTLTESQWSAGSSATVADLNDDARSDIVFYDAASGAARLAFSEPKGGFTFKTQSWTPGLILHAADFTATGRQGLFGYSAQSGVWFSGTQTAKGWVQQTGQWTTGFRIAIADLDGDHRDDVVSYDPVTGLGFRCATLSAVAFNCKPDSWSAGRLFIGRDR
jgi:hypothetical protein